MHNILNQSSNKTKPKKKETRSPIIQNPNKLHNLDVSNMVSSTI